jgi:uncharacterized Zn-finger protein
LGQIDLIVHDKLYDYSLVFDLEWAQPYWMTLRLIHIWIIIPSVLGAITLGFDIWKNKINNTKTESKHESKLVPIENLPRKGDSMLISCPSCKKTFSKPLVMLDFSSRKAKLVNVCPYCDKKLGEANENNNEEIETEILSPDDEVRTSR